MDWHTDGHMDKAATIIFILYKYNKSNSHHTTASQLTRVELGLPVFGDGVRSAQEVEGCGVYDLQVGQCGIPPIGHMAHHIYQLLRLEETCKRHILKFISSLDFVKKVYFLFLLTNRILIIVYIQNR